MRAPALRRGSRLNALGTRLFAAIGLIVVLSVGLTLAIGAVLTRRAVDRATLRDVRNQADLLAERERVALLPFAHLGSLKPFLERQGERLAEAAPEAGGPGRRPRGVPGDPLEDLGQGRPDDRLLEGPAPRPLERGRRLAHVLREGLRGCTPSGPSAVMRAMHEFVVP
jgi:hypothetical protein